MRLQAAKIQEDIVHQKALEEETAVGHRGSVSSLDKSDDKFEQERIENRV